MRSGMHKVLYIALRLHPATEPMPLKVNAAHPGDLVIQERSPTQDPAEGSNLFV